MKPILYGKNELEFKSNGIGVLSDALHCEITNELEGAYTLVLKYPVNGVFFDEIINDRLILATPGKGMQTQPFYVYNVSKPINGVVTVNAEHVSYRLSKIPVNPFTAQNAKEAVAAIKTNSETYNPFNFSTDKDVTAQMNIEVPRSARAAVLGESGSLLDTYSGDILFDRYDVKLLSRLGSDKGITIKYGKNMTDFSEGLDSSSIFTGVYPYCVDGEGTVHILPEKVIYMDGYNASNAKVKILDASQYFTDPSEITEEALRSYAAAYLKNNVSDKIKQSIKVSFVNLADTEEYKNIAPLEEISIGDTVRIEYPEYGIDVKSRCVKTVYDALRERYTSVHIGDVKKSIVDTLARTATKEYVTKTSDGVERRLKQTIKAVNGEFVSAIEEIATTTKELTKTVETQGTEIYQNKEAISLRAYQSSVDELSGRVHAAETSIELAHDEIRLKASASELDSLSGTVSQMESRITQNANSITAEVSRAQSAESSLEGQIDTISEGFARIAVSVDANSAAISNIVSWQEGTSSSIASIESKVDKNTSEINLRAIKTDVDTEIAAISLRVDEQNESVIELQADLVSVKSQYLRIGDNITLGADGIIRIGSDSYEGAGSITAGGANFARDEYSISVDAYGIVLSGNQHVLYIDQEGVSGAEYISVNEANISTLDVGTIKVGTAQLILGANGYVMWVEP